MQQISRLFLGGCKTTAPDVSKASLSITTRQPCNTSDKNKNIIYKY